MRRLSSLRSRSGLSWRSSVYFQLFPATPISTCSLTHMLEQMSVVEANPLLQARGRGRQKRTACNGSERAAKENLLEHRAPPQCPERARCGMSYKAGKTCAYCQELRPARRRGKAGRTGASTGQRRIISCTESQATTGVRRSYRDQSVHVGCVEARKRRASNTTHEERRRAQSERGDGLLVVGVRVHEEQRLREQCVRVGHSWGVRAGRGGERAGGWTRWGRVRGV